MKITLLADNPKSWIIPYVKKLEKKLRALGHEVANVNEPSKIPKGDLAFFLSCETIIPKKNLEKNRHNLVVHESTLPRGKGWSPLTWQILQGKNEIPITLFEAQEKVDSGPIYLQETMIFRGDELLGELHKVQGEKTIKMILKFVKNYPSKTFKKQQGRQSHYRKRKPQDSELDVNNTIAEQFNLLRVVDNEKYPAFFKYRGKKFVLKIIKALS